MSAKRTYIHESYDWAGTTHRRLVRVEGMVGTPLCTIHGDRYHNPERAQFEASMADVLCLFLNGDVAALEKACFAWHANAETLDERASKP